MTARGKREALRALFLLPPMVKHEQIKKAGAFRVHSHRVWSRLPVGDARFAERAARGRGRDEVDALVRTYAHRGGRN